MPRENVKELRLLLVENDDLIRSLIVESLKELWPHVTAMKSASEALSFLQVGEIDLLMTALFLPNMDGLELAQRARQLHPQIKIALVTDSRRDLVSDAVESGLIDLVIRKPFQTSNFRESITALFTYRA